MDAVNVGNDYIYTFFFRVLEGGRKLRKLKTMEINFCVVLK